MSSVTADPLEQSALRRVRWRLLPFLFVLYIFSYLDRSNVSVAALQMNDELRFSSAVFGFGAGVFFVGYALFEIPSNFVLTRVGARRWIARIMVTWGMLATAMMFIRTPVQFYIVRFLLGVAEAGFFPAVIYYLAAWFPIKHRGRAIALFVVAIPLSQVVSGVIAGPILSLGGTAGLSGWQWLFLLEGIPSFVLGIVVWFYLTDQPRDALWLPDPERQWLIARLDQDQKRAPLQQPGYLRSLLDPVSWMLALMYWAYYTMALGYVVWLPLLIRDALATRDTATGFITAGISLVSAGSYFTAAKLSDLNDDRCFYAVLGLGLSAAGCLGAAYAPLAWLKVVALAVIPIGGGVFLPSFWCLPTVKFSGASAASVIALISAVGASGGFFGPSIIGFLKTSTGGDVAAFVTLAGIGAVGSALGMMLRLQRVFPSRTA